MSSCWGWSGGIFTRSKAKAWGLAAKEGKVAPAGTPVANSQRAVQAEKQ